MKSKAGKVIVILLTSMMLSSLATVFPVHAMPEVFAKVFVDPPESIYYSNVTGKCSDIQVDVAIFNMTGLFGFEFKLYWDPNLLSGVSMEEVLFHTTMPNQTEIDANLKLYAHEVASDHVWYAYTYLDLDRAIAEGYAPINITAAEYPEGMTAATITLHVERIPTKLEDFIDCALEITESVPGDYDANVIPHTVEHGYYKNIWAEPVTMPWLSVDPPTYTAKSEGEVFPIDIMINDLEAGWEMIGLEFKLGYNSTILEVLSVTEGDFMKSFNMSLGPEVTFFTYHIEEDLGYVIVGILCYPDENGTWHKPFPHTDGPGLLATINFRAIYQGVFPEVASCTLDLYDSLGGDTRAVEVPFGTEEDGYYKIIAKVVGRAVDVYTQYPFPYGGQGIDEPSDAFAPQDVVILYANVTYNEDPVQHKLVSFEIRHGSFDIPLSGFTDENGVVSVSFTIPWPCENPEEEIFGIWNVTAVCSIAGILESDTLRFRVGWLIEIKGVTPKKAEYLKDEHMEFEVELKTISAQMRHTVLTAVVLDELGVPIGTIILNCFEFGGAPLLGEKSEPFILVCLYIPKWAFIGTATIHANAFDFLPWDGGSAYCPQVTATVAIVRP